MKNESRTALPLDFNLPDAREEIQGRDGRTYLQFATHMTTFYKQTYGELSRFFMALRDLRLIGATCDRCRQVMVPAATWHCANCDFAEMREIELPHRGVLAATAPITIFPSATFLGDAPFCRGYVDVATDAPIASYLPSRLRTTTGLERPGIFVKGVQLKLVFEDERVGSIRDIFWVPVSELTPDQVAKRPLLASDLDFATPPMPAVKQDPKRRGAYDKAIADIEKASRDVERSPRAKKDLAGRTHTVAVKTAGGDFRLFVANEGLRVERGLSGKAEFTMVCEDPAIFSRWIDNGSLSDAAVEGTLWLPDKTAFQLLPILDRLPRSIRRDMRG